MESSVRKRTENRAVGISLKDLTIYTALIWIVVCSCLFINPDLDSGLSKILFFPPWLRMAGQTIAHGIDLVSAKAPLYQIYLKAWDICMILIFFWVGPFLFLIGVRDFICSNNKTSKKFHRAKLKIFTGGIFVANLLWGALSTIYNIPVFTKMVEERTTTKAAEQLFNSYLSTTYEAIQFYIKNNKNDTSNRIPLLSELPTDNAFDKDQIIITPIQEKDTVFVITFVADVPGYDAEFKNINGQTGKMQFSQPVLTNPAYLGYINSIGCREN